MTRGGDHQPGGTSQDGRGRCATWAGLIASLRAERPLLVEEWARLVDEGKLLSALTRRQVDEEIAAAFEGCLAVLEAATAEGERVSASELAARLLGRGATSPDVVGIVLLLRGVVRLLADDHLREGGPGPSLDALAQAADRIACMVALALVREGERLVHQQQRAIRELLEVAAARESGSVAPGDGHLLASRDDGVDRGP